MKRQEVNETANKLWPTMWCTLKTSVLLVTLLRAVVAQCLSLSLHAFSIAWHDIVQTMAAVSGTGSWMSHSASNLGKNLWWCGNTEFMPAQNHGFFSDFENDGKIWWTGEAHGGVSSVITDSTQGYYNGQLGTLQQRESQSRNDLCLLIVKLIEISYVSFELIAGERPTNTTNS